MREIFELAFEKISTITIKWKVSKDLVCDLEQHSKFKSSYVSCGVLD